MTGILDQFDKQKFNALDNRFNKLRKPFIENLKAIEAEKEKTLCRFMPFQVAIHVHNFILTKHFGWWISGGLCFLGFFIDSFELFQVALIFAFIFYLIPEYFTQGLISLIRPTASYLLKNELNCHEEDRLACLDELKKLRADFDSEYGRLCETTHSYPPDWGLRRTQVRERDGGKCVNCGWPDGHKRKSRELHTHHVIPISAGGGHSLNNLETLCHICHRVEHSHRGIRNSRRKSRDQSSH